MVLKVRKRPLLVSAARPLPSLTHQLFFRETFLAPDAAVHSVICHLCPFGFYPRHLEFLICDRAVILLLLRPQGL